MAHESWAPKITVVELRRHAPRYLDLQGAVAQKLLENYDGFTIEGAPIRYLEALVTGDNRWRAAINGHHCLFQALDLEDVEAFERNSRSYFKVIESEVAPESYDRVGVLFSFPFEPPVSLDEWYRQVTSYESHQDWTIEDASIRLTRSAADWGQIITLRRWGTEDAGVDPTSFRIDLDQYQLQVPQKAAWNINVAERFEQARQALDQVLRIGSRYD